ncbi:hypothetical protein U1Q18_022027 [Sarracenia purpurea var. burkii]
MRLSGGSSCRRSHCRLGIGRISSRKGSNRVVGVRHGKHGSWHIYSQESGHAFTPSWSIEKIMIEESHRSSGFPVDGKCSRNSKENKGSFCLKDWKGRSRILPHCYSDQRSVDDMLPHNSHPNSDFVNSWDQLLFKDQHNEIGSANDMGTGQRFERENSLGPIDRKPRKWNRSGSLSAQGSGFSHSSSSKTMGVDSEEANKAELQKGNSAPVQSPSRDAVARATSPAPSEETSSRKKPRLGWGEGLAKYEKKKVEGPDDSATKHGMVVCVNTEPFHSHFSDLSDKSPRFTGFSECASPASATCSSSRDVEDKPAAKAVRNDTDTSRLNSPPSVLPRNHVGGIASNLQKLKSTPTLSFSICELLQSLNPNSVDYSSDRATAIDKLPVWKGNILKAIEIIESKIELLENELKSLTAGGLEEKHCQFKDRDVDTTGTVMSKFVESLSSEKTSALSESVKHGVSNCDWDAGKSVNQVNCSVDASNEEKMEGLSASESGGQLLASKICAADRKYILYDLILASNKDSSNRASEVFDKLLPSSDRCHTDMLRTAIVCISPKDALIMKKIAMRKQFLRFKERVIALKFRAFQHLRKEDMPLLSISKHCAKSSIHSRFSSPAGNSSLAPTTEITKFISKLLSDSKVKGYRNSLKMPALILDKREMISRFISNNGLVEDPYAVEKEKVMINPWTTEEKKIFMDKFATFGKEFGKIASFLHHKTTADCIQFYYKNHRSDCFVKIKKKPEFAKQAMFCFTNNYLITSGKRWNRETNAASLDMLGGTISVNDCGGVENQQECPMRLLMGETSVYRAPQGNVDILERSRILEIFGYKRDETVAADVLAGICASLSSEAMSSCIPSSCNHGERYKNWKCQKFGSSTGRPKIPRVMQNVNDDDETCSYDSCGEMGPTDWTDDEKSIFIQAVASYQTDFTMISRFVRTRSRDECKVFFSKARKCLGLDMICHRPGNEEMPVSDNADDSGNDDRNEDACVVETGSVICSEKLGSKIDENPMISNLNINNCESNPAETMNVQTELNRSETSNVMGEIDCKVAETHFDCDSKMENGIGSLFVQVRALKNASLSSAKEASNHGLSRLGVEGEIISVGSELEGSQQLASESILSNKQEAIQHEKKLNPETLSTLDSEKISYNQCRKSAGVSDYDVITNKEVNGDISSKNLASLQSLSKADNNVSSDMHSSQEFFFRKCNGPQTQSSVAELPLLSQEQRRDHSRPSSWSPLDREKQCRNGDVKLFGQILMHPMSQQNHNASIGNANEENEIHHPKLSSKKLNVTINDTHSQDGNSVPTSFDTEQLPLGSVEKSDKSNLNSLPISSSSSKKEKSSSNAVENYQLCRNRKRARVQTLAMQHHDSLFS